MNIEKGRYQHFKGGNYEVIDVARCSETLEYFVVYRALYGEKGLWIRPLSMFLENVTINENVKPRFQKVEA